MKTPIEKLAEQITPLPYIVDDEVILTSEEDPQTIAYASDHRNRTSRKKNEHKANLIYIAHAANNFMPLVKLVDRIYRDALISNAENPINREHLIEQCKAILANAEHVEI